MAKEIDVDGLTRLYEVDKEMAKLGVLVLPRKRVESWVPKQLSELSLISIRNPEEQPLPETITSIYANVLEIVVDDVLESSPLKNKKTFTLEQAEKLYNFFQTISGSSVVIHCFAGVARSASVAVCFALYEKNYKLLNKLYNDKFSPNNTIIRKFLDYCALMNEPLLP